MPEIETLPVAPASFTPLADLREDGFNQVRKDAFLIALGKSKGSIPRAAELIGISFATIYNHLQKDPFFKLNVELKKRELTGKLVKSAYTVAVRPEASGHADRKMLLKAWLPEEFGDRPSVAVMIDMASLTQAGGMPIPGLSATEPPTEIDHVPSSTVSPTVKSDG